MGSNDDEYPMSNLPNHPDFEWLRNRLEEISSKTPAAGRLAAELWFLLAFLKTVEIEPPELRKLHIEEMDKLGKSTLGPNSAKTKEQQRRGFAIGAVELLQEDGTLQNLARDTVCKYFDLSRDTLRDWIRKYDKQEIPKNYRASPRFFADKLKSDVEKMQKTHTIREALKCLLGLPD